MSGGFYGPAQAGIHHRRFGDLALDAAATLVASLRAHGLMSGTVTDLGAGSGLLAAAALAAGYDVTGIDISPAMVELARATAPGATFRLGSALTAEVGPSVGVTATGEVLNYATDPGAGLDALGTVAARVFDALVPGGVFLLDLSKPGRNLGQPVRFVFHDHEDWALGLRAEETPGRLDRHIVIFERGADGRWDRIEEHHVLHLYDAGRARRVLEGAGFVVDARPSYGVTPTASMPPEGWVVFEATKPAER